MGNNKICGPLPESLGRLTQLQRIVLHQNKLSGPVPPELWRLGCIVNLAGNAGLQHGGDVPLTERFALEELYRSTLGSQWTVRTGWTSSLPVASWYKVGVLGSHVHRFAVDRVPYITHAPHTDDFLTV